MSYQPIDGYTPEIRVRSARLEPFINNCYRPARDELGRAYAARTPGVTLVSEGRVGPNLVIEKFLEQLDDDVTVAHISSTCTDATTCMREIIEGIGFESAKMNLSELEGVLEMFLGFQRGKKNRTIICYEKSQSNDQWVQDRLQHLIETEANEKYGLMIIRSEPPSGNADFPESVIESVGGGNTTRIFLSPFTLSETREFVRRRVESPDAEGFRVDDVGQIFEFFAVTLIHEFSAGVPEKVERLCNRSLRLMRDAGDTEVSTNTVRTAAKLLSMDGLQTEDDTSSSQALNDKAATEPGKLIVQCPGEPVNEVLLDQNSILIGRDPLCAICIAGLKVSRYHALVALSATGVHLVDLGSTNGTNLNDKRIERCVIRDGDVIAVGHIRIKYVAGGEQVTQELLNQQSNGFDADEEENTEPSINYVGSNVQLVQTS